MKRKRKRKRITLEQFLAKMKRLKVEWHLDGLGRIRCSSGKCPIEAVAKVERGQYDEGAEMLGLTEKQKSSIMNVADYVWDRRLRRQMMKVAKLKERVAE